MFYLSFEPNKYPYSIQSKFFYVKSINNIYYIINVDFQINSSTLRIYREQGSIYFYILDYFQSRFLKRNEIVGANSE